MKFSLTVATLFCFTTWINLIQAFTAPVQDCLCVAVSKTKVHHSQIKSYTIQEDDMCPIKAVVFQTVKCKTICSDPNDSWAKRVVSRIKDRNVMVLNVTCKVEQNSVPTVPV